MRVDLEIIGTASLHWLPPTHSSYEHLVSLARRAEEYAFSGLLIFYDHKVLDPWAVAAVLLQHTSSLVPVVALQPYTMPPYTAAKMVSSLTSLYRRRIDLNVITGAAPEELTQVCDPLDHDGRYERAGEYVHVLRRLLTCDEPLTWDGPYYQCRKLRMNSTLPKSVQPQIFVAGSSDANRRLVEQTKAVTITHPEPVDRFAQTFIASRVGLALPVGIRVGLVARPTSQEAWQAALNDHQVTRAARLRTLLKRESESDWNRRLAALAADSEVHDEVYWTGLYSAGRTGAPVLVGDYDEVADYLQRYLALGVTKLLLTRIDSEDDFRHTRAVLQRVGS